MWMSASRETGIRHSRADRTTVSESCCSGYFHTTLLPQSPTLHPCMPWPDSKHTSRLAVCLALDMAERPTSCTACLGRRVRWRAVCAAFRACCRTSTAIRARRKRESMAFASAVVPMMLLHRFQHWGMSHESIILAGAAVYLLIRFGLAALAEALHGSSRDVSQSAGGRGVWRDRVSAGLGRRRAAADLQGGGGVDRLSLAPRCSTRSTASSGVMGCG